MSIGNVLEAIVMVALLPCVAVIVVRLNNLEKEVSILKYPFLGGDDSEAFFRAEQDNER